MLTPIYITTREEYEFVEGRGFCPLLDYRHFTLDIRLRVDIQTELFGRGVIDTMQANSKFFRWVWEHKPHYCEETMRPLNEFSPIYCSHILPRGAYPECATDPRNINILCYEKHAEWENGDRTKMRIYHANLEIIDILKREYRELHENY